MPGPRSRSRRAGWATQKRGGRARRAAGPTATPRRALDAPIYVDHRLDAHDGGSIYVVEAGEGPPIVLSHGVTLSVRTWFHQLELLPKEASARSRSTTAVTVESVLGEAGHSLENLAEDVRTRARGLDLRDAVLVGHSMGGVAVQAFVIALPRARGRARRAASCCCRRSRRRRSGRARRARRRASNGSFNHVPDSTMACGTSPEPRVPRRAARASASDPHPSHVELVRQMMLDVPAGDAPRRAAGARRARPHRTSSRASGSRRSSSAAPPTCSRRRRTRAIAELIPGARLELVPGGGHMLMLERTEELDRPDRRLRARGRRGCAGGDTPTLAPVSELRRSPGVRVGHWTGDGTGVTVVLLPEGDGRRGEVRGGAPATREIALLEPTRAVDAGRRGRVRRRLRVRARGRRRRDALPRRATARGSRRRVARCRSCRPRAIFDLVESGGAPPGAPTRATRPRSRRRATSRSRSGGSARAAARRSGSGAAASTRCPAGVGVADARRRRRARRRARGGQRGRRRDRRRRRGARGIDRAAGRARVPDARAVRGGRRQHDARASSSPTPCATSSACHLRRAERARRLRAGAAPGAHPLRRRPRDRAGDGRRRRPPRPAPRRRPPTSWPTAIRGAVAPG